MSKYFTDIMTQLLLCVPPQSSRLDYEGIIEETISYMNEHLNEDISIGELAEKALMSEYHFIRIFQREYFLCFL